MIPLPCFVSLGKNLCRATEKASPDRTVGFCDRPAPARQRENDQACDNGREAFPLLGARSFTKAEEGSPTAEQALREFGDLAAAALDPAANPVPTYKAIKDAASKVVGLSAGYGAPAWRA